MPYIKSNQSKIYYTIVGKDIPIVLIPGLAANHRNWGFQLLHLKKNFKLIAIDNRGIGKSEGDINSLKIEDMAADINTLLTSLDLSNVNILGHSMGSMVAIEYTLQHPEKVSSLILSSMPVYNAFDNTKKPTEKLRYFLENGDMKKFDKKIFSYQFSSDFRNSVKYRAMEGLLSKNNRDHNPHVILLQLNAIREWKQLRRWEQQLNKPCMVIYGAEDEFAKVETGFLSRIFPYATIEIVKDAGHAVHIEKPKEFNDIVTRFVENQMSKGNYRI